MIDNSRVTLSVHREVRHEAAMRDAITALEIAAELPSAQRCQAFIRAFIAEEAWAVRDVAERRGK